MKTQILLVTFIASHMLCLAEDSRVEKEKRIWGASYMRERTGEGKDRMLTFDDISQGPEHLVGGFVLERVKETAPQLVMQGHFNKSGEFTPNVSLEVGDQHAGPWKIIESSFSDKVDVTLTGAPHLDKLFMRIQLDAFQPYIGKFKFCRVTLQTGESDVFPMAWLTEKGE
jgi:hypothetical protein